MRFSPIFRPSVCVLEDRTVPTTLFRNLALPSPLPGPVTHFQVIAPASVQTGQALGVQVIAEDANNRIVTGYRGEVRFTLGTADGGALLPSLYVFTPTDAGAHTFALTLSATGAQKIKVTDTLGITGSAATTVCPPQIATHFVLITPTSATAGAPVNVTVEALDASNRIVSGYTGAVHFTSSDASALLPSDTTFTAANGGSLQVQVTFAMAGQQTLMVSSVSGSAITGTATVQVGSNMSFGGWNWNANGMWGYPWSTNWAGPWMYFV